jgi:hypothetical protein
MTVSGFTIARAFRTVGANRYTPGEAQGIPLKAFGNWRARFKAEPQPPKLLYRRRCLSHTIVIALVIGLVI